METLGNYQLQASPTTQILAWLPVYWLLTSLKQEIVILLLHAN